MQQWEGIDDDRCRGWQEKTLPEVADFVVKGGENFQVFNLSIE